MDDLDRRLLHRLMRNGRATWSDLAVELGITAPAIAQRVRRLERAGVIRQFAAWVDPQAVAPLAAFVSAWLPADGDHGAFREQAAKLEPVQECHWVAGEDAYLLKVRCATTAQLERLVRTLTDDLGAARTRTRVVLATVKESPVLPMGDDPAEEGRP